MPENSVQRKLTAILCADVKGYSRMMGEDEVGTFHTLSDYLEIMNTIIAAHRGRVFSSPGDAILAQFRSVVDAVQCAVEIQEKIEAKNADVPVDRKMRLRIGVNLGDVIEKEEQIYGDGVNIAARIETLAEPGGVSISKTVYNHVQNKLNFGYEYQGEHQVKNIANPVKVYKVLTAPEYAGQLIGEPKAPKLISKNPAIAIFAVLAIVVVSVIWQFYPRAPEIEPASVENMAYPLPDKPSIAVLPFENMSGDPAQDYLSDGLAEQIINTLSRFKTLFVISGSSTSTYKGKSVKIQKIAEDLGVRYVLEGSVQKSADRIRINAQLVDATTGHHIWSQRYDREQKEIFAIQDDITLEITKALQADIMSGEQARIWAKNSTTNLEAWEKWLQGDEYMFRFTKEDNATARRLFEEVIVLDPEYAYAYVMLGWTYYLDARFGWVDSRAESFKMAGKYAQKGMELNDTLDNAYLLMGGFYFNQGQYEKAIAEVERAIALNPNGAQNYNGLAAMVGGFGRWDESIELAKKAIRLHPYAPATFYHSLGRAYFMTGHYDEAIATLKKGLLNNPNYYPAHAFLAACYSSLDRHPEAAAEADEVRRINPKFNLESYAKTLPYKNKADIERYITALRKAGIPDKPPLPLPDKPSIAVLAFDNLSGDPEQEFFSDGITEDIITALSKTPNLFVIARNSTFTYKGKPVKVQEVGRDLGVRYVLEGSVRKVGEKVRITAQLVDAKTGHHLWADKYDRKPKDIFALQDEITMEIITALQVKLTEGEQARIRSKGTDSLEAYLKVIKARELARRTNIEDNQKARQILKEALELDPQYARIYRMLSVTHNADVWLGSTKSPRESLKKAVELSKKALSIDKSLGDAHAQLGNIYIMTKRYEEGMAELEKAVELYPNGADVHARLALGLNCIDKPEEAILMAKKAIRLNPIAPSFYLNHLAIAYRTIGNYKEALVWSEKAVKQEPTSLLSRVTLCSIYYLAGRMEEARLQVIEIVKLNPKFSLKKLEKTLPYKNIEAKNDVIEALRKAGLPE